MRMQFRLFSWHFGYIIFSSSDDNCLIIHVSTDWHICCFSSGNVPEDFWPRKAYDGGEMYLAVLMGL